MVDGTHTRHELGGVFLDAKGAADATGVVRLVHLHNQDEITGVMFLLAPEAPGRRIQPLDKVRIRVEIWTDADERLLSREFVVSPIDELKLR